MNDQYVDDPIDRWSMEWIISLIGKLDRKVDWVEMYMERMIGSLGRKVDIGRKMNDPDGALDPLFLII